MISMPEAIRTLLKSKIMVGTNRPTTEVQIAGQPSGETDFTDLPVYTDTSRLNHVITYFCGNGVADRFSVSNFVWDSNNVEYCVIADTASGFLMKGTMSANENYLSMNNPITTLSSLGINIATDLTNVNKQKVLLQKMSDGSVLMFVYEAMIVNTRGMTVSCYKSSSGDGDDFVFLSTVSTETTGTYVMNGQGLQDTFVTKDGTILVSICTPIPWDATYRFTGPRVCRSTDGGLTWTMVLNVKTGGYGYHGQIAQLLDGTILFPYVEGSARGYFYYSANDGATWTREEATTWESGINLDFPIGLFAGVDQVFATSLTEEAKYAANDTYSVVKLLANWTDITGTWPGSVTDWCKIYPNYRNRMVVQFSALDLSYTSILGLEPSTPEEVRVKNVEVDMSKGMATQAIVTLDNKGGMYSPDPAGNWYHLIWPNNTVTVKLGYGSTLQQVFTGLIDQVVMNANPAEIQFVARDMSKKTIDQTVNMIYNGTKVYSIEYQWQNLEDIFYDLAIRAGWTADKIITETSNINVEEIRFSHESWADAMQRLCELGGFETYVDYVGNIYFVHATDRSPAVTDWELTFTAYDTKYQLQHIPGVNPIVENSIVLHYGTTIYTKDVDYSYDDADGTITALSTGSIPLNQTNAISYVYAAWVYTEGEDLITLGYSITDEDIYSKIIVISQDSSDPPVFCRGDEDFEGVRYYNVLADKVMIVSATDVASTADQCATLAKRTGAASLTKARIANFEVVGNPYLQVGDCIQVIETSSTISEIYRITDISLRLDAASGSFKNNITAYHYGYVPM